MPVLSPKLYYRGRRLGDAKVKQSNFKEDKYYNKDI